MVFGKPVDGLIAIAEPVSVSCGLTAGNLEL